MSSVGERIRKRRLHLGYTQERLAEVARISKGFVSEVESGNRNISAENLLRVAYALGVTLDYLMKGGPETAPGTLPKGIQFPASFAAFAKEENLPFDVACALLEARLQIVANRRSTGTENLEAFDWKGFYEAVKDYL
jgi:transcriptional regulator with XRE-family HTH domain